MPNYFNKIRQTGLPFSVIALIFCALFFISLARAQATIQFLEDDAEENTDISFALQPAPGGRFSLVFHYRDKDNFYALDCAPGSASLRSVIAGSSHKLASTPVTWKAPSQVVVQRRAWLMQVVVNGTVVLTAYDVTFSDGKIGSAGNGGWAWSTPRVQPVEAELFFNDDFTRESGQTGEWKNDSGAWKLTSSSDNITAGNQAMSANPFSYQAQAGSTPSFARAGRAFWDSYHAQVSVRPAGQGAIGLAVYVQDAKNYLAFLWNSQESESARQLVLVRNGQSQVLAKASGAYLSRQWYRLGVRTSPGFIETFIDGAPVFRARSNAFGQGAIGLYAAQTAANFDDVRVRSYPYFRQDFSGPTGGAWTPDGGFWRAANGVLNSASKPGDGGATRMLLTGDENWSNYELTASGKTGAAGSCGLIVGFQNAKNYTVFRWAGAGSTLPFKGRAQFLRYDNGAAKVLSDTPAPMPDGDGFARIKLRFRSGAITAFSGDEIIAQAADEALQNGRVGLWAQGAATSAFQNVVMFLPPEDDAPKVPPAMEADALMVGWASSAGEWSPRKTKTGLEFWNGGEFFGDATLEYSWRPKLVGENAVEWALRADGEKFESGYVLRAQGKDTLKILLSRGDEILKTAQADLKKLDVTEANPAKIKIELEGRAILVTVNGIPILSYLAQAGGTPGGTRLAARGAGAFILPVKDLRAVSASRDDYTFNEAPTDWYAPSGTWNIFSRWPCYSDWSFFGGKGLNPVLWSKREYSGDIIAEMYVHPQMSLPKELGYAHPGDLNITLCGDGKNVSSGYSFVLAGWSNTRSAILKNASVVAENTGDGAWFEQAINHNSTFHRRWYYVRAEARRATQNGKNGLRLKFFVDEKLLAEYFDPHPLETFERGRAAFWTLDGAMMIARAKIENEKPGARFLPSGLPDAMQSTPAPTSGNALIAKPLISDGAPTSLVETSDDIFKVINPAGGGQFAVSLQRVTGNDAWRIGSDAKFSADFSLPREAKIDVYFTLDGVRHLVEITGAQRADARVQKLGDATLQAGQEENGTTWRRATFALGAALKKLYPQRETFAIERIEIGALHGDEYRWQGLFGNSLGTSYEIKNATLE